MTNRSLIGKTPMWQRTPVLKIVERTAGQLSDGCTTVQERFEKRPR